MGLSDFEQLNLIKGQITTTIAYCIFLCRFVFCQGKGMRNFMVAGC